MERLVCVVALLFLGPVAAAQSGFEPLNRWKAACSAGNQTALAHYLASSSEPSVDAGRQVSGCGRGASLLVRFGGQGSDPRQCESSRRRASATGPSECDFSSGDDVADEFGREAVRG